MKDVLLAPLADDDVRETYEWFAARSPELALRWIHALDETLARVGEFPELYQVIAHDVRRAIVSKFPFGVFFRDTGEYLRVIAVVDLRRDPSTWKSRR